MDRDPAFGRVVLMPEGLVKVYGTGWQKFMPALTPGFAPGRLQATKPN